MSIDCVPTTSNVRMMQGQATCSFTFSHSLRLIKTGSVRFAMASGRGNCGCGRVEIFETWLTPFTRFAMEDFQGSLTLSTEETNTSCPGLYTYAIAVTNKNAVTNIVQTGRINLLFNPLNKFTPCECGCCKSIGAC